jgi:hypothetical protein
MGHTLVLTPHKTNPIQEIVGYGKEHKEHSFFSFVLNLFRQKNNSLPKLYPQFLYNHSMSTTTLKRTACINRLNISKSTLLAYFSDDSSIKTYLQSLNDDQWHIDSFDNFTRECCLTILSDVGETHLSLILS